MTKIAYVINNKAFFVSHRLALAEHAIKLGYSVKLFTGNPGNHSLEELATRAIAELDLPYANVGFSTGGTNPLVEIYGLLLLIFQLRRFDPDIVHCISPKGVLYGGIASRLTRVKSVVFAISGMGYAFTQTENGFFRRFLIKKFYQAISRYYYKHKNIRVIVQNNDDQRLVIASGQVPKKDVILIPGSGVRLEDFVGCSAENKERIVLLPARMLRDKGVIEFIKSAKIISEYFPEWKFVLAGAADYKNPSAISSEEMEKLQQDGSIEWLGHVDDMKALFARAAIVCLPSYREGMPKALLEAAAAGCAVVTTDVTGCREAIVDGETGDLVPVRNTEALSKTLLALIHDENRRIRYGINGQKRAQKCFSIGAVVEQTFNIYREISQNV